MNAPFLKHFAILSLVALFFEVGERFGQKAAGAAGGVEHNFSELRIGHRDHELDNGTRRVELARVAGGVAHFAEHRLVQPGQSVNFLGRIEMDAVNKIDHIAQQIAGEHAVVHALEHGGDHVPAAVAVGRLQRAQIGQ